MLVINSVTGCSTCNRVFISRKKKFLSLSTINSTVPALEYPTAFANLQACSPISLRVFSSRKELGASSTTFWFLRWIEHSRSPK